MPKKINFVKWQRFWKRTVLWEESHKWITRLIKCKCDCWKVSWVWASMLNQWRSKSCWCSFRTHWMTNTRIFKIFDHIKQRCTNPNNPNRPRYWWKWVKNLRKSFEDFYRDMWESYEEHVKQFGEKETTIDRIDSNWDYCKENCRWATRFEQGNNLSTNRSVTYKWKYYPTLSSLCREYWIKPTTLNMRINKYELTLEKAIELPLQDRKHWFSKIEQSWRKKN